MIDNIIWSILEFAVCLADMLLLFLLAANHTDAELTLKKLFYI